MIIGDGLIAKAFGHYKNNPKVLIFASGVSNSKSCSADECSREKHLMKSELLKINGDILFVYFSSCSLINGNLKNDLYHLHKKEMEAIIEQSGKKFSIFRLPNIIGKTNNKRTLFTFLFYKIYTNQVFELWRGTKRNLLDIDDAVRIVRYIIDNDLFINEVTNVANIKQISTEEIVKEIEKLLGMKAKVKNVNMTENYNIDTKKVESILDKVGINFDDNYLQKVLSKYAQEYLHE